VLLVKVRMKHFVEGMAPIVLLQLPNEGARCKQLIFLAKALLEKFKDEHKGKRPNYSKAVTLTELICLALDLDAKGFRLHGEEVAKLVDLLDKSVNLMPEVRHYVTTRVRSVHMACPGFKT